MARSTQTTRPVAGFRVETDSMGQVNVPASAYYGAQTQRAVDNFPISGLRFPRRFIRAMGLIKRSVQSGIEVSFSESLAIERELQQQLFQSEDAKEGVTAYNEKRKPNFAGR
jgi:aspartate ammonia-lyase